MAERSEMDKILPTPVEVILGGGKYTISPLPIKYAISWNKKVIALLLKTTKFAKSEIINQKIEEVDTALLETILTESMSDDPEKLVDLFFEYARKLDRSILEETATSSEIINGFKEVLKFELPFLLGRNALTAIMPKSQRVQSSSS